MSVILNCFKVAEKNLKIDDHAINKTQPVGYQSIDIYRFLTFGIRTVQVTSYNLNTVTSILRHIVLGCRILRLAG